MMVVGVDVSKSELVYAMGDRVAKVKNEPLALEKWVATLPEGTLVGLEATGRYHRSALKVLHEAKVQAYLLNPMRVSRYIKAMSPTVKTDKKDAQMIARYVEREHDLLVPFKMPSEDLQELKDLLSYRETVMDKQVALRQSFSEQSFSLTTSTTLEDAFEKHLKEVDRKIGQIAKKRPLYKRFLTISGVGPLSASALVWLFEAHQFNSSDQAVAYVGLDVSVRQSGRYEGKTKLTNRGPAFIRTFLHNGANSLRNIPELKPLFTHHEAKGLAPTAVNLLIARKFIRIAYALAKSDTATFERKNLLPQVKKKSTLPLT